MPDLAETVPPGREPETPLKGTVSKCRRIALRPGQHRSPPHSDLSSKYGTWYERIIAFTFPCKQPIYEKVVCPDCGAPMRWLLLRERQIQRITGRTSSELSSLCSAGCVPPLPEQRAEPIAKPAPDAIRMRQYRVFSRRRCCDSCFYNTRQDR